MLVFVGKRVVVALRVWLGRRLQQQCLDPRQRSKRRVRFSQRSPFFGVGLVESKSVMTLQ